MKRRPPKDAEAKKREIMRRAKTATENTHNLGGIVKSGGHAPRPVTLPKLPWPGKESDS
jgi:hypothetical protein